MDSKEELLDSDAESDEEWRKLILGLSTEHGPVINVVKENRLSAFLAIEDGPDNAEEDYSSAFLATEHGPVNAEDDQPINVEGVFKLLALPNELILIVLEILGSIGPITLLASVPRVCQHLRVLCALVNKELALNQYSWWQQRGQNLTILFGGLGAIQQLFPRINRSRLGLEEVNTLELSSANLTMVPQSIGMLTALRILDVSGNQLTALPDSIGALGALTALDVSGNQLTALPDSIGALRALEFLDVSDNQLTDLVIESELELALPDSIGQLTALTTLDVSDNKLTALPHSIGGLTALKTLNVPYNKLRALPDSIGDLTALTIFNVSFNKLTVLPNSIGRLTALIMLDVSKNKLKALPDSIGNLRALEIILTDPNIVGLEIVQPR